MNAGISQAVLERIVAGVDTLAGLVTALGCSERSARNAVDRLKRLGLVKGSSTFVATEGGQEWVADGRKLVSGRGKKNVRVSHGLRQRAWWVLRRCKSASLAELLSALADGSEKNAAANLGAWLRVLEKSGFLAGTRKGRSEGGAKQRYELVRDNGRGAPVWRRESGTVYDPNTGEIFAVQGAERPEVNDEPGL